MKLARPLVWTLVGLAVLGVVALLAIPRCASSEGVREEIERRLTEAIGRPVTIGAIEVTDAATRAELRDVTIAPPAGLAEHGEFLRIGSLQFDVGTDALRRGDVTGAVVGRDVALSLVRAGEQTSIDGLGRRSATTPKQVALDLAFELRDVQVTLRDVDRDETMTLDGVGLRGVLSHRGDERDAGVQVTIDTVDVAGVSLRNVLLSGSDHDGVFAVHRLRAEIGEGTIEGRGRFDPTAGDDVPSWRVDVEADEVALDGPVASLVARLYPVVAGETEGMAGSIGATVSLTGQGLTRARALQTLRGHGKVVLHDLSFSDTSLAAALFELAGAGDGQVQLAEATAAFRIEQGWVHLDEVTSSEPSLDLRLRGRVSLAGELDVSVDLMPLVRRFGGGIYEQAARYTTRLPIGIGGTLRAPALAAPPVEEVAKGVLGGLLRRALTEPPSP